MQALGLRTARALQRRLRTVWRVRLAGLTLVLNPRLRSTPARFLAKWSRIEVSGASAESPDLARIVVHELAHAAAVELHGPRVRPHGKEWRRLVQVAEAAGLFASEPTANRRQPRRTPPADPKRYLHTCPVCHFSRAARRRVTAWRCPECRAAGLPGTLTIERRA